MVREGGRAQSFWSATLTQVADGLRRVVISLTVLLRVVVARSACVESSPVPRTKVGPGCSVDSMLVKGFLGFTVPC